MRRSLKKLRYMTEFFAPLFSSKEVKPFVKQLKTLQDVFGYVTDVRMAEQIAASRPSMAKGRTAPLQPASCSAPMKKRLPKPGRTHKKRRRLKSRDRFWL